MQKKRFEHLETPKAEKEPKKKSVARFFRKLELPGEIRYEPPPDPEPPREAPKETAPAAETPPPWSAPPPPAYKPESQTASARISRYQKEIDERDRAYQLEQLRQRKTQAWLRIGAGLLFFIPSLMFYLTIPGTRRPPLWLIIGAIVFGLLRGRRRGSGGWWQ